MMGQALTSSGKQPTVLEGWGQNNGPTENTGQEGGKQRSLPVCSIP